MPNYDFTEEDFAPKSKFDFTEEDFNPTSANEFGLPKFKPLQALAEPTQKDIEDAQTQASPIKDIGRGLHIAGKSLIAGLADVGDVLVSEGQKANTTAGVVDPVIGEYTPHPRGENIQALMESGGMGPLPAEDLRPLPKPLQMIGRGAQGLIETTPKLAAVAGAQAMGIPAPLAAGAVFGLTPKGFDPVQGAVAAALPFVGKYSGAMVEALAGKLGVTKDVALATFNKMGGATGAAGYLKAIDESEIAKLPPEQRDQARIDSWANVASQAALGMMGERESKTETKTIQPKEESARTHETPTPLHADVLSPTFEGEKQVPTEKGSEGIPAPEKEVQAQVTPAVVSKMTPDEFNDFAGKDATGKGYDLAKEIGTEGDRSVLDEGEKSAVAELTAGMKALEKATPEQMDQVFKDVQIINGKKQYFNEAKRMLSAMDDVKSGKSVAEAAKDKGVGEKRLADAVKNEYPPEYPERPATRGLQLKQPSPAMGEAGAINLSGLNDFFDKTSGAVKSAFNFARDVGKEVTSLDKLNDYRRAVLNWSAKLQRSFGEAASIQRDITKQVKYPIRRDAITNWIQANGDPAVLRQRAADSEGNLAKGYEAALTLTPEELAVANQMKQRFASLERRGNRYDVLNSHKDNYVPQIWDLGKGPTGSAMGRSLKQKFRFSKARVFNNFFEGEQADFVPKTKDISKLLPVYMHEMESVIAARELVEDMSKGKASDGRPLVASKGVGIPVENPGAEKATLVMPKVPTEETKDYRVLPNQPALENWKWVSKDDQGNPIFLKADLALHPEAYNKLKNVLGKSAIKDWYQTPTSAVMAIPKTITKGLDMAVSEVKKTMLGVLSPFHQVQEATHAAGHRVNPTFNIPKIDLVRDAGQMDAARHGLMLQPDKASENQFMEGFKQSKIISKIPGIGPASDWYSNYLFNEYIPGLKYKTYQAILDRNTKVYAKDLASGKVGIEDVKVLSAEQANAAFGHLNYADLGRNPTIQHIAQLGILAPDFFESRIRFAGQAVKGATGLKVGREQLLALATLALGQAAIAYTSAKITGGQWDEKHPFEMTLNGKRYTLRSVPEDIQKFMQEPRQFLHNRLSILGKAGLQYSSGVNYKGQKVTAGETTKELAQQPIPLAARGFMHIGELSGWDQLLGAVGLKVSKASPRSDIMQQARDWGMNNRNPKIKAQYERLAKETLPDSVYKPLRQSLESNDRNKILESVREILKVEPDRAAKEKRMKQILKEFEPFTAKDVKPFATRSKENEIKFLHSMDAPGKAAYRQAIKEQVDQYRNLTAALYGRAQNPPIPEQYREAYGGR